MDSMSLGRLCPAFGVDAALVKQEAVGEREAEAEGAAAQHRRLPPHRAQTGHMGLGVRAEPRASDRPPLLEPLLDGLAGGEAAETERSQDYQCDDLGPREGGEGWAVGAIWGAY